MIVNIIYASHKFASWNQLPEMAQKTVHTNTDTTKMVPTELHQEINDKWMLPNTVFSERRTWP